MGSGLSLSPMLVTREVVALKYMEARLVNLLVTACGWMEAEGRGGMCSEMVMPIRPMEATGVS